MSRPRDGLVDDAVHLATLSLLAEVGYDGVTMAEVARRASTVPPTVYRRHRNVRDLVLATLRRELATLPDHETPDPGALRADLLAFVADVASAMTPDRVAIVAGLLLPLRRDPELAAALRTELEFLGGTRGQLIIDRAVDRGELHLDPDSADLRIVAMVVPAMIFHRLTLMNLPIDDDFTADLVDTVLLPALHQAEAACAVRRP